MYVRASTNDDASSLEVVGPSNAIFVDVAGNDATGQRGNAAFPFLTMQAALAVAQSGDAILIGPGSFSSGAATVTLPALANLIIRGYGELSGDTTLTANVNIDALTLNAANRSILIQSVRLAVTGTGRGLVGTGGAGAAGNFMLNGLKLNNVDITTGGGDAINLTEANQIVLFNVQSVSAGTFVTCSDIRMRGESSLAVVNHTWDNSDVNKPAAQAVGLQLSAGASITSWIGTGQPLINALPGSVIGSSQGTAMTGLNLSVSTGLAPSLNVHGSVGNCDFNSAGAKQLPDGAVTATLVDFSGAVLLGISYSFGDAANVTNQAINFTGVRTSAAVTLTAGLRCNMDERGASFAVQPTYVSSGATLGTHIPPKFLVLGTAAIAATVVALGFTAGNTNYMASAQESAAAGTPVTTGAKTTTQVTINIGGAPAGTIDTLFTWL